MPPIKVNHVAIVAEDLDTALSFWRDAFGLEVRHTEHNDEEEVDLAFLPIGESEIEIISPFTEESGVAKYLAKKGSGMHHVCIDVDDIEAAIAQLAANGAEVLTDGPKSRPDGTRYTFVHPKSTGGVLLELYEIKK